MPHFVTSETGAVTVDWVVLTAGLVGLGLATMGVVSGGVEDLSGDTRDEMTSSVIYTTFDQRKYSSLYIARMAQEAAGLHSWLTSGADQFASDIAYLEALDDTDLVTAIATHEANASVHQARADHVNAVGDGNWTLESAVQASAHVEGLSEAQIDGAVAFLTFKLNSQYGGDMAIMAQSFNESATVSTAYTETVKEMADERGLTY